MTTHLARLLKSPSFRESILVYAAYSFRFISPLLLYPFLTRALGDKGFAVYATGYTIAILISVVGEYGFNLTGTRDIAATEDEREQTNVVTNVFYAKTVLLFPTALFGLVLGLTSPLLSADLSTVIASSILGTAMGYSCFWYFQGKRKVVIAVSLEVSGQLLALLLIITCIDSPDQFDSALIIQACFASIATAAGCWLMLRDHPIVTSFSLREAISTLRRGFPIFISRSAVMIYGSAGTFVLGFTSTAANVAWYSAAERIIAPSAALLRPMSTLLLPRLSAIAVSAPQRAAKITTYVAGFIGALYVVAALVICATSPIIFEFFFGEEFATGFTTLSILAFVMPIAALNTIIINQFMVALRLDQWISRIVISGLIISMPLSIVLANIYGSIGMAAARILTEIAILTLAVYASIRFLRSHALRERSVLAGTPPTT